VDNTYQGEEEGMEGDGDNENDSDGQDPQKSKDRYTPLWKYVTKLCDIIHRGVYLSLEFWGS
jgi:hypothetical protein